MRGVPPHMRGVPAQLRGGRLHFVKLLRPLMASRGCPGLPSLWSTQTCRPPHAHAGPARDPGGWVCWAQHVCSASQTAGCPCEFNLPLHVVCNTIEGRWGKVAGIKLEHWERWPSGATTVPMIDCARLFYHKEACHFGPNGFVSIIMAGACQWACCDIGVLKCPKTPVQWDVSKHEVSQSLDSQLGGNPHS